MNRPLTHLLALSMTATLTAASASSVNLLRTFEVPPGIRYQGFAENSAWFYFNLPDATRLEVQARRFVYPSTNAVTRVDFLFKREYLKPAELKIAQGMVWNVARSCLNLLPARQAAINAWVATMNKKATVNALTSFGPMSIHFKRYIDGKGQYITDIGVGRDGRPGANPWGNYCVDTQE